MTFPNETADDCAFGYMLEQLYEAIRGYSTAYAVLVNPDAVPTLCELPPWRDLSDDDLSELLDEFGAAVIHLIKGAGLVIASRRSTDKE